MNRTRTISFDADFSSFNRSTDEAASRADRALNRANSTHSGADSEMRNTASDIFRQMAEDAEKMSKNQSERNRLIREEITLLQQANMLEEQRARIQAKAKFEDAKEKHKRGQITRTELEKEESEYRRASRQTSEDSSSNRTLTQTLRNYSTHYSSRSLDDNNDEDDGSGNNTVDKKKEKRRGNGDGWSQFGTAMVGGAAGAFGLSAFMGIQSFISKIIHDAEKLDIAKGGIMGLKGQEGKIGASGMGEASGFGLSGADFLTYSKGVGKSLGRANMGDSAINQLAIEKRFGLEDGSLNDLNKTSRMGSYGKNGRGERGIDSSGIVAGMVTELKSSNAYGFKSGDFSLLGEKISDLSSIMESFGENSEGGMGGATASNLISAFSRVGGSFADQRQVGSIGQIDKSIRNPNSEFSQAMMFRAIKAQDPDQSLFDIMKRQEQGATPQNITAVMDVLGKGGDNENTYFNVSQALGLRLGQAQNLTKSYLDPKGDFKDDLNSYETIDNESGGFVNNSRRLGKRAPGTIQQFSASVENLSASKGSQAIQALQPVMETALDAVDVAGDILVTIFKGASTLFEFAKKTTDAFEKYIKPTDDNENPKNGNSSKKPAQGTNAKPGGTSSIDTELLRDIKNILMDGNRMNRTEQLKKSYWDNVG